MSDLPAIEISVTEADLSDAAIEAVAKLLVDWAEARQDKIEALAAIDSQF